MNKAFWMVAAAALMALPACGGSDTSTKGGGGGGQTSGGSTTSGQTCTQNFSCVNGACTCSDGPNKDQSCCDPSDDTCTQNKCDSFCKVCM